VVADKALCSNGYVYNYTDFEVPDSLISGSVRFETERLLLKTGTNKYGWDEEKVKVITTGSFPPVKEYVPTASNDSVLSVYFTENFQGTFSLEFNVDNLWPREYLMVVNTKMYVGGIYDIYLNDELVMTMNWKDYEANRGIRWSVNGKDVYVPDQQGFNRFDAFVENKLDYGISKIRFEYTGPGNVLSNGFVIDYIEFFPVND